MARPKKPSHLHVVSGTVRKDRINPNEPQATHGTPSPPPWLSTRGCELFFEICADLERLGVLAIEWGALISDYALTREQIEVTTAILEDLGPVYSTTTTKGSTMFRARPEVAMRNEALRRAQILRSELGLGPASKSRVSAATRIEENPFLKL